MPTYAFRCPTGHAFDRFFKTISTAPTEHACPECGKVAERQLSAGAGLVFKGSGFYLTDYGKNAHRAAAPDKKGDGAPGAAKDGKADGGTAKPDAGSSAKTSGESSAPASKAEPAKPAGTSKPKPKSA